MRSSVSRSVRVLLSCGVALALALPTASATPTSRAPGARTPVPASTAAATSAVTSPAQARARSVSLEQARAGRTRAALRLPPSQRLVVTDVIRDADGKTHVRYDRTYRGLPVVGGDLVVHRSATGVIRYVDWGSRADLSALRSINPSIAASAALRAAQRTSQLSRVAEAPSLAVWAVGKAPHLAWRTTVAGMRAGDPARDAVYVDARTGGTLAHWSELQTSDAAGTGHSMYSGDVTIHTNSITGGFEMRDLTRAGHRVITMNNSTVEGLIFTKASNTWGDGTETDPATAAVDAQYGAAETWDFYQGTFGRNGIADDGVAAYSRVHYSPNGGGYDNAFWSDSCFCMTYGDGNQFNPLTSLDVAGHEMSHGVTSHTAGLLYFGESGGLNEATSDIFGTGVEFAAANAADPADYYIGEKIVPFAPNFLRRMDNPQADAPLYPPGTHSYNCWVPLMGRDDVHFTSGVANHFFYLLSEGTGAKTIGGLPHKSTTCNGTTIKRIGPNAATARTRALQIWYRALTVYLTAGSSYADARDATVRAARDLYGNSSAVCKTVEKTWTGLKVKPNVWGCSGLRFKGRGNAVKNGGFEAGVVKWLPSAAGIILNTLFSFSGPRTGDWYAFLNGFGVANTQSITQKVALPNARKVTLVYHLLIVSNDVSTSRHDTVRVQVKQGKQAYKTLATFDNRQWDWTYKRQTANLSTYRGKTVRLRFIGVEDATVTTAFLIDDVAVTKG